VNNISNALGWLLFLVVILFEATMASFIVFGIMWLIGQPFSFLLSFLSCFVFGFFQSFLQVMIKPIPNKTNGDDDYDDFGDFK